MAMQQRQVQTLARVFRVLGDATRLRILLMLKKRESNVTDLCKALSVSQPTVSHHLGILRMNSVVNGRRDGKEIYYSICDSNKSNSAKALRGLLNGSSAIKLGPVVLARA